MQRVAGLGQRTLSPALNPTGVRPVVWPEPPSGTFSQALSQLSLVFRLSLFFPSFVPQLAGTWCYTLLSC